MTNRHNYGQDFNAFLLYNSGERNDTMNWLKSLNDSLNYIEDNLTEPITCEDVAKKAYASYHHYLRLFNILSGIPLSEYIRNRRMSSAAADLVVSKNKIIDIAFKYQYTTPESFSKAFKRFHGISPSEARRSSARECL